MKNRYIAIGMAVAALNIGSVSAQSQKPSEPSKDTQHHQMMQGLTDAQFVPMMIRHHQQGIEMARLAQEIQKETEQYAKRPKRKYISANTQEYEFAAYMRAWVARIERIGNLNYPDEARRQQLHGDVLLTVTLNKDGTVNRMDVIQGSGHKLLDDAVQRIVQLAAPFPPIPKTGEDIDELYITRTWQFLPGDVLRNR